MFTFGFSYVGAIYLLMLFMPNIIWAKNQPQGYSADGENRILAALERIGEAACTCCVLVFSDFNIRITPWALWLGISFLLMLLYEAYWVRYFKSPKNMEDFYKPMLGISVPGATLPVIAFILLGIYGTNIFLIVSGVILGIGHIGIHREHYREINSDKPRKRKRIAKTAVCAILGCALAVISFFIGARNINYMNHYRLILNGVDEQIYVELGGQEQYLLVRGADQRNPVIVFLHGGPSSPDSFVNYCWTDDLLADYTVIDWDQRGCGRTYVHNRKTDPQNTTATYEQALADLDDLADYALKRFGQDQLILVGHSYGTILAADYMERHPEKVSAYVAIAQVVSMDMNNTVLANDAMAAAKAIGRSDHKIKARLADYKATPTVINTLMLRNEAIPFLPEALPDQMVRLSLFSAYMGMPDLQWYIKSFAPVEDYLKLNSSLFDALNGFDLYKVKTSDNIPITYISGSRDYICPVSAIADYISKSGVNGKLYIVDECGHGVQYTKPHEVSRIILHALAGN